MFESLDEFGRVVVVEFAVFEVDADVEAVELDAGESGVGVDGERDGQASELTNNDPLVRQ